MINTIVFGFYILCGQDGICTSAGALFEDMKTCESANVQVLDAVLQVNKQRPTDNQWELVEWQCIEYDKPAKKPNL
jgi:hypothetical protein|tara:strand:+ start:5402 stop:5629 length:228 start_codon:yes stop_codon:yes gene_type:complete